MVKEIKAWQAEDGSVHATLLDAVVHDAEQKLIALKMFNEGTVREILNRVLAVHAAIEPLAIHLDRVPVAMEAPDAIAS